MLLVLHVVTLCMHVSAVQCWLQSPLRFRSLAANPANILVLQVKVVVSSGGSFVRLPSGAWEYEGGSMQALVKESNIKEREVVSQDATV